MTKRNRIIILAITVVAVLALGLFLALRSSSTPATDTDADTDTAIPTDETDETPVVPEVKQPEEETDEATEEPTTEPEEAEDSDKNKVLPFVSNWEKAGSQLKARGYVASVVEDGGTCKFVVKDSDGQMVASAETEGVIAGTNTSCPEATIDISDLSFSVPSDKYDLFLEYSSNTSSGTSPAAEGF